VYWHLCKYETYNLLIYKRREESIRVVFIKDFKSDYLKNAFLVFNIKLFIY